MTTPDEVLDATYAALAALYVNATCPRSTRCCRFAKTGRTPYLWPVEARRVLAAIGRRGGRLARGGGAGDCPLIKPDGGCSIYEDRPFGCRTYFCGDATLPDGHPRREIDRLAKDLRAAAEQDGKPELLPLTTWLERSFATDGRRLKGR